MTIRLAQEKDIQGILELLSQVLEIHAAIRPDIFISGTTKYTEVELKKIIANAKTPIYVAVTETDQVAGYVFCIFKEQPASNNMVPFQSLYIDDLCVDASLRGQHVGEMLFTFVKDLARKTGCYEVTLNVWAGNDSAIHFYKKMGLKEKSTMMEWIVSE